MFSIVEARNVSEIVRARRGGRYRVAPRVLDGTQRLGAEVNVALIDECVHIRASVLGRRHERSVAVEALLDVAQDRRRVQDRPTVVHEDRHGARRVPLQVRVLEMIVLPVPSDVEVDAVARPAEADLLKGESHLLAARAVVEVVEFERAAGGHERRLWPADRDEAPHLADAIYHQALDREE